MSQSMNLRKLSILLFWRLFLSLLLMLLEDIGQDICFEFYDKHIN